VLDLLPRKEQVDKASNDSENGYEDDSDDSVRITESGILDAVNE